MKRLIATVLACVVLSGSAAWAGTFPKEQVGAGAKWAAYLDVKEFLGSELGQYILTEAKARGLQEKLQEGIDKLGLDVTKDLHSVLLYGESFDGAEGAAIIRGRFNKDKVLAELAKNPTDKESKYGDRSIHQWTDEHVNGPKDDGARFGTFYQDGVVIITRSEKSLKSAIDVLDGKAANLAKEGKLEIPDVKGSFILAAMEGFAPPKEEGAPARGRRGQGPQANMMQGITKGWMAAGYEDENMFLRVCATTKTAEDATRMAQMAQGLLAMAQLATAQQAQGDEPASKPAMDLSPLLAGIKVTNKENVVQMEAIVAVKDMKEMLGAAIKMDDARKAARKDKAQ